MPVVRHGDLGVVEDRNAAWSKSMATELIHFTWYPPGARELKSRWKLPHHRSSDDRVVWRGLVAAAAAVLGARGGVDIPRADMPAVRAHLGREYRRFGERAPWDREGLLYAEEWIELLDVLHEIGEQPALVLVSDEVSKEERLHIAGLLLAASLDEVEILDYQSNTSSLFYEDELRRDERLLVLTDRLALVTRRMQEQSNTEDEPVATESADTKSAHTEDDSITTNDAGWQGVMEVRDMRDDEFASLRAKLKDVAEGASPSDFYTATLRITDDAVNRKFMKFGKRELEQIAEMINRDTIPFTRNHNFNDTDLKFGRVFEARVVRRRDSEARHEVRAKAFIPKRDAYSEIVQAMRDGVQREGSLSFNIERLTCSVCGNDIRDIAKCPHLPGMKYEEDGEAKLCIGLKENVTDVYEFSLVTVPAVRHAGVIGVADGLKDFDAIIDDFLAKKAEMLNSAQAEKITEEVEEMEKTKMKDMESVPEGPITENEEANGPGPQENDRRAEVDHLAEALGKLAESIGEGLKRIEAKIESLNFSEKGEKTGAANDPEPEEVPAAPGMLFRRGNKASRRFLQMCEDDERALLPQRVKVNGRWMLQPNIVKLGELPSQRYLRENREEIFSGLDDMFRDVFGADAVTVSTDVPDEFLTTMTAFLREPSLERFVFSNDRWIVTAVQLGTPPGDTIAVPRFPYNARPTASADRELSPGTRIGTAANAITEKSKNVVIKRYALKPPLGLSRFTRLRSVHDLERFVRRNLGVDYQALVDVRVRELFDTATTVVFPNGHTASTVAAGDTFSYDFLHDVARELDTRKVPTFPDTGNWGLIIHPYACAQLAKDPAFRDTLARLGDQRAIEGFRAAANGGQPGFIGSVLHFDIYVTNNYAVGDPNASPPDPGTQIENNVATRTSFAFGPDIIGQGVGDPVRVARNNDDDFGEEILLTWISYEGWDELDINEDATTETETRVLALHTTDS